MSIYNHIAEWAEDPYGGGWFPDVRDEVLSHDPTCKTITSLAVWLPSKGGRSCDLTWCAACNLTYYIDGGSGREICDSDDKKRWIDLCECCNRKSDSKILTARDKRWAKEEAEMQERIRKRKEELQ